MDSRRYYFTCHPRYIEAKARELVFALAGGDSYSYYRAQDIAGILYTVGLSRPSHRRTVALIARSVMIDLYWQNLELQKDLLDELVDLATSQFITSWADEIDRSSEVSESDTWASESSGMSSDEDNFLFKASNPRLEECMYSMLYDEDCDLSDVDHISSTTDHSRPHIVVTCASPTPSEAYEAKEPGPGLDDLGDADTPLLAVTIMLGDLFAMGLVPAPTMQTSTLYVAENLLNATDGHSLYTLLTRAASHLAPQLGVPFLQQCRAHVVKNQSVLEANGYHHVPSILGVIDELINCESTYSSGPNTVHYSHLARHRWDPSLPSDISWGL